MDVYELHVILAHMQASASSPLEPGSGDSNTGNCMGLCGEGYECIEGSCSKTSCIKDCSNEPYAPLCATEINTIAETFNNECELDNRKCENKDDQWLRIYDEPCKWNINHIMQCIFCSLLSNNSEARKLYCAE